MRILNLLWPLLFPLTITVVLAISPWAYALNQRPSIRPSSLVTSPFSQLTYHKGPIMTGPSPINLYIIWYGVFSPMHKTTITDFFASFNQALNPKLDPTVSTWWKTTQFYKDAKGKSVSGTVRLLGEVSDVKCSLGKNLKRASIAFLVKKMIANKTFLADPTAIYFVLTASDVHVEQFCMNSCGFHNSVMVSPSQRVVYAHVGDPGTQCPGLCAWPYAAPAYGPPQVLVAPNGVGIDGMVMNVATILAGAATNPFQTGYFQGDALAPLEALTACSGVFGEGAYSGYPGKLLMDSRNKASYNAYGVKGRKFLLPAMWDLLTKTCKVGA
ncbi:Exordium like [Thalictrum thalictroides]|uniref:Exordium like n=1 Tax=Thalictrum thalictroides TaxID=46969 RepID=A0A7J6W8K6_THATH|nr:Exordium like [Thalictrum thalictroides]